VSSATIGLLGLVLGSVTLVWGIIWSIWFYRRIHHPKMLVNVQPAVMRAGPDMSFMPEKGGRPRKIPEGALLNMCLSIQALNIGPASITIDHVSVAPADRKRKKLPLKDCWIAVQQEERLPKVVAPGSIWEGLCDYVWLKHNLEQSIGSRQVWNLSVIVNDINGQKYTGQILISDEIFSVMSQRHQMALA
jgi:hypothetical protein